ncbi:LysR family transcriptional regulator, partial [Massilia sp. CT11-108]|uniref:LysR family transcriptional regulator n=1 Tax=Massilia sp. CT11-108 TaxID=3393900 RepID=UPI0039A676C8
MELRHFRYFVAVAEELHFARAAERLGIAPSTLTVQIQEIERTLQARLLQRTKRSVGLTAAGELFLEQARARRGGGPVWFRQGRAPATGRQGG